MLRVTVELVPEEKERRTLAVAEIGNIGGAELADYRAEVGDEVTGLKIAAIKQYPRWSASTWDLVLRCIAKALWGEEQIPPRPTPVLALVPVHPSRAGHVYPYVLFDEIPETARAAFVENMAHSSTPGRGAAFAHDWTDFIKGQR